MKRLGEQDIYLTDFYSPLRYNSLRTFNLGRRSMSALRVLAFLFGIAFIFAGIAGFLPQFTPEGLLFGYFEVDSFHNSIHLITGLLAILASVQNFSKLFFQVFGVLYAIVTIVGFWKGGDFFGIMHMNPYDNYLHLGITIVTLYFGFLFKRTK